MAGDRAVMWCNITREQCNKVPVLNVIRGILTRTHTYRLVHEHQLRV